MNAVRKFFRRLFGADPPPSTVAPNDLRLEHELAAARLVESINAYRRVVDEVVTISRKDRTRHNAQPMGKPR